VLLVISRNPVVIKNMLQKFIRISFLLVVLLAVNVHVNAQSERQLAVKIEAENLYNLHKVDDVLYRSEQPAANGMSELEMIGLKSVVNLRRTRKDNRKARKTNLELHHVRINTWTIDYENLVAALKAIDRAQKPVLIHCMHGSDRAGAVTAAYRIAFNGWTKEEALKELRFGGFGFHESWFPNIVQLIESIDEQQLRKDAGIGVNPEASVPVDAKRK
jgi:tyrosine-protein phosphatase SIW14